VTGLLVVGYGSPIRGDDAVGWRAAELLLADPRLAGATVLARHQLTPELAEDVAGAGTVVLIDACTAPAGSVAVTEVVRTGGAEQASAWSHDVAPRDLLEVAARLYGRVPRMLVVSVGAASFEPGTALSEPVEAALPSVVAEVVRLAARSGVTAEAGR
jgi:hydrogenase maturation protease